MGRIYKTAMGKSLDFDRMLLKNETVIAVGNRRVNAGGDELGPGGKIVKSRDQVMREYYALNSPTADIGLSQVKADEMDAEFNADAETPATEAPAPVATTQADTQSVPVTTRREPKIKARQSQGE